MYSGVHNHVKVKCMTTAQRPGGEQKKYTVLRFLHYTCDTLSLEGRPC